MLQRGSWTECASCSGSKISNFKKVYERAAAHCTPAEKHCAHNSPVKKYAENSPRPLLGALRDRMSREKKGAEPSCRMARKSPYVFSSLKSHFGHYNTQRKKLVSLSFTTKKPHLFRFHCQYTKRLCIFFSYHIESNKIQFHIHRTTSVFLHNVFFLTLNMTSGRSMRRRYVLFSFDLSLSLSFSPLFRQIRSGDKLTTYRRIDIC